MYSADKLVQKKPGSSHSGNLQAKKNPVRGICLKKGKGKGKECSEI